MRIVILSLSLVLAFAAHADVPGITLEDESYTASLIDSDETVFFVSQTTDLAGLKKIPPVTIISLSR